MTEMSQHKGILMDGSALAHQMIENDKKEIKDNKYNPRLAAIIVGTDKGCYTYQQMKERKCAEVGIRYSLYAYTNPPEPSVIKEMITKLNKDEDITGVMVQLPLPANYNENEILELVATEKDVDGLNSVNIGRSYYNTDVFVPCAAEGIIRMLKAYELDVKSKKAVVLGRGSLLGTPVAQLLERENAFVTKIHSIVNEDDVIRELSTADVVISATGKAGLIDADMLKEGAIIFDCANTKSEREFKDSVFDKASYYSTVPGGIGPMTISVLINNVVKAYKRSIEVL